MESLLTALSVLIWIIVGIIALVAGTIILMIVACTIYTLYSFNQRKDKRSCTELRNSAWLAVGLKTRS